MSVLIGHEYGSIALSVFRASKGSDAMFLNILVNLWNSKPPSVFPVSSK